MSDDSRNEEPEQDTIYVFDADEDTFVQVDSSRNINVVEVGKTFLIDGHMHIESLNCTPLQLQWATTYLAAGMKMTDDRKELTKVLTGQGLIGFLAKLFATKDFGEIGQYYTDSIGKMYMGRMERNMDRLAFEWMFDEDKVDSGIQKKEKNHEKVTDKKLKTSKNFFNCGVSGRYYKNFKPFHISVAQPMDLDYAHFWGVHRIPMYLNISNEARSRLGINSDSTFFFINDYRKVSPVYREVMNPGGTGTHVELEEYRLLYDFDPLKKGFFETAGVRNRKHHLLYDFPLAEEYVNFKTFHQGGAVKPEHIVSFDADAIEEIVKEHAPGSTEWAEKMNDKFHQLDNIYSFENTGAKYNHFLDPVPLDNIEIYEDYTEQIGYYAATAFRFPMKFLPFYHFDPRRHYNDANKSSIIPTILDEHRFFTVEDRRGEKAVQGYDKVPNVMPVDCLDHDYFNELFFEGKYETDDWSGHKKLQQAPYKKHINEAFYNLFPTKADDEKGSPNPKITFPPHLFWGVKMYPPLGYSPDIYKQEQSRYNLPPDYYAHVKELFEYCGKAQIPIIAHGSPLGMSIGDGFNYIKNDHAAQEREGLSGGGPGDWYSWLKNKKNNGDIREYTKKECALYVDQTNTHVLSWKRVIGDHPDLRYCFAHFGSSTIWEKELSLFSDSLNETSSKDELDKQREKNKQLIFEINFKRMSKLADWRRMISECITDSNHIYTDISCYTLSTTMHFNSYEDEDQLPGVKIRERIARELLAAMNDNKALFNKIIMGSDWYMTERSHNGTGEYYKGMFLMLQQLSREYENSQYDLWHQFSVINPLKFLGLLKDNPTEIDDGNGNKYYELNTDKITRYLDHLEVIYTNKDDTEYAKWWEYAGINEKEDIKKAMIHKTIQKYRESFENAEKYRIYTSESMMNREDNKSIKDL